VNNAATHAQVGKKLLNTFLYSQFITIVTILCANFRAVFCKKSTCVMLEDDLLRHPQIKGPAQRTLKKLKPRARFKAVIENT
jgi:hypothetical protein